MTATRVYRFNALWLLDCRPSERLRLRILSGIPSVFIHRTLCPALDFHSMTLPVDGYAPQGPRLQASAQRLIPSDNDSVRLLLSHLCSRPR